MDQNFADYDGLKLHWADRVAAPICDADNGSHLSINSSHSLRGPLFSGTGWQLRVWFRKKMEQVTAQTG
jgi:hypothetical protein